MPEPAPVPGHFIRFVGWLREDGTFSLDRGWETPKVTEPPRGCGEYRLDLLDRQRTILESVLPQVKSSGCEPVGGRMKTFRVLGYMPWHPDAATIIFRKGERVIDERGVAAEPPSVTNAVARVSDDTLYLKWEATHDQPLFYKVALVQGRRRFPVVDRATETSATMPIANIPLQGECEAVVVATDKLRSRTIRSAPFVLPPKSPRVVILKPLHREVFCEGTGLSLVGHAIALDGRSLDDPPLEWRVDGVGVVEGSRVAWIQALEVGTHRIQLAWRHDQGAVETIEIDVRGRSVREEEWFRDLAAFRTATANSDV